MFEVTPRDITNLNDSDLRELVARLCIAALAAKQHPPHYVSWGGDQRARDGGIDVWLEAPKKVAKEVEFPRHLIGFQVKRTSMPKSEIRSEMCPGGVLRPSIRAIIAAQGAYIIVSFESCSHSMYNERKDAMREAIAGTEGSDAALVDFYDVRRITDWANRYPGVVAWVRERLGKPFQGWRPHGQWAISRGGKEHPFVGDNSPRLVDPTDRDQRPYPLLEGLQRVRTLLQREGVSVRIAGLSGVGKTRFAQALFEEDAAENAIDPSVVVYCDTSDEPVPTPLALLDELIGTQRRSIVVVDNCSSELHASLAARCNGSSIVSLLTIEYDIREDIPDETSVFRLEPASSELVAEVIKQQFPHISQVDAATITHFSEGNSRVAIALAGAVENGVGRLTNDVLFKRLFWQKHGENDTLLRVAQACSLVYSFDGENQEDELPRLAALAGVDVQVLYREVNTLLQRGLAQKRGVWRAVLPHAIATRLAGQALPSIHLDLITKHLVKDHERLLRSFSRRLGYLHDSDEAASIVRAWLAEGGLLGDVASLRVHLVDVLRNVAPVDPGAVLEAIERAAACASSEWFLSKENYNRTTIVRLLRSIAYEARFFERCLAILVKFFLAESPDNGVSRIDQIISALFTLYLSGTHASMEQRLSWIRAQLQSADEKVQTLAIQCLESALESSHFTSVHGFDFGAQSRDYGYAPQNHQDVINWFASFIELAVDRGAQESALGVKIRNLLAGRFRSLWSDTHMYDQLESAIGKLMPLGWEQGWLAIRQTIRFDKAGMNPEGLRRLVAVEQLARPSTLVDETRAIVLSSSSATFGIADDDESNGSHPYRRIEHRAEDLGKQVASDAEALTALLPSLVENRQGHLWRFGSGLAQSADHPEGMWQQLVAAFEATTASKRNVQVLCGYLGALHDSNRSLFEQLLESAMDNAVLAEWFPVLQTCTTIDESGCNRLIRALEMDVAEVDKYLHLAYGSASDQLSDADMARLARTIAGKTDGAPIALEILAMYLFGRKSAGPDVAAFVRELMPEAPFALPRHHQIHTHFEQLIKKCMTGPDGESSAKALLRNLRTALDDHSMLSAYDFHDAIAALLEAHPIATLDELIDTKEHNPYGFNRILMMEDHAGGSLFSRVPPETLIQWCRNGDPDRWPRLALSIPLFDSNEDHSLSWSDMALALTQQAPEPMKVIQSLLHRLEPMHWSGSRAAAMSKRLPLLDALETLVGSDDLAELRRYREGFEQKIEREQRREQDEQSRRDTRFE